MQGLRSLAERQYSLCGGAGEKEPACHFTPCIVEEKDLQAGGGGAADHDALLEGVERSQQA